jgi:Flp pilus assembly pilin Flp
LHEASGDPFNAIKASALCEILICGVAVRQIGKLCRVRPSSSASSADCDPISSETFRNALSIALIAAGISVVIIATVNALGVQLTSVFSTVTSQLPTAGK